MNIHEYQAKTLLARYGLPVLAGRLASSVEEAVTGAAELDGPLWVVKAQIHAGGRGKGGGIKLAKSEEEVRELSIAMLGMNLVTQQTGAEGKTGEFHGPRARAQGPKPLESKNNSEIRREDSTAPSGRLRKFVALRTLRRALHGRFRRV